MAPKRSPPDCVVFIRFIFCWGRGFRTLRYHPSRWPSNQLKYSPILAAARGIEPLTLAWQAKLNAERNLRQINLFTLLYHLTIPLVVDVKGLEPMSGCLLFATSILTWTRTTQPPRPNPIRTEYSPTTSLQSWLDSNQQPPKAVGHTYHKYFMTSSPQPSDWLDEQSFSLGPN